MSDQPQDRPEPVQFDESTADQRVDDDDEADDIAAFYAAQEVAFACMRERYEARPRRKL